MLATPQRGLLTAVVAAVVITLVGAGSAAAAPVRTEDANSAARPTSAGRSIGAAAAVRNVVNGSTVSAPSRTAPWAVALYRSEDERQEPVYLCSAAAIGPRELLTAAHCVNEPGFYYVRVGAHLLYRGRQIAVEAVDFNPGYRATRSDNDVAVLRTVEPMDLKSYARVGTPALAQKARSGGARLTVYGWGRNERGATTGHLRTAVLVPRPAAAANYFGRYFNGKLMLAAGSFNRTTKRYAGGCSGDSGGPLVVHIGGAAHVVGVTSFGGPDCTDGTPTIFTSVGNYAPWIGAALRGLPALAIRSNRAVPVLKAAPRIRGSLAVGSVLTCTPGAWTSNAQVFDYSWTRGPGGVPVSDGPQYQLTAADAGQRLTCRVYVSSTAGTAQGSASVVTPA